jgi:predicted PolB exonuclease-like 3'-5' exonuclease
MSGYAIFDIETRVDKALLNATLYPEAGLSDEDAFQKHSAELVEEYGRDFVSIPFHVPISIAVGATDQRHRLLKVETLGKGGEWTQERELVDDFWTRAEAFPGCLVSFNGRGFDLPVLKLQALKYGIAIPRHLETKYGARYRFQTDHHLDLQEFLTNNGACRIRGGLDVLLRLCGFDGKGMRGADVQAFYEAGRMDEINAYCRRDVVSTYQLFLRVQVMRGKLRFAEAEELARAAAAQATAVAA